MSFAARSQMSELRLGAVRPWAAAIFTHPGDGSELLVDWIAIGCRDADLAVDAAPTADGRVIQVRVAPASHAEQIGAAASMSGPVDVLVATEHAEVVRAIASGRAAPERTTIVASSTRCYGRAEVARGAAALLYETEIDRMMRRASRRCFVADVHQVLEWHRLPAIAQPAVLLGMLCASRSIGLDAPGCRAAIRRLGLAVEANLLAFDVGLRHGRVEGGRVVRHLTAQQFVRKRRAAIRRRDRDAFARLIDRIEHEIPASQRTQVREWAFALARSTSIDSALQLVEVCALVGNRERFAQIDLEESIVGGVARGCALLLRATDVASIAATLISRERLASLRKRHRLGPEDVYELHDHLPLNRADLADVVPAWIARHVDRTGSMLRATTRRRRVATTTVRGALLLRGLAALGRFRSDTPRRMAEQATFDQFVGTLSDALAVDHGLAAIVARSATLVHGVGAVRDASRRTAETFWGSVVRQSIAIDRQLPAGDDTFGQVVIPPLFQRLVEGGPVVLWDEVPSIVACGLHLSRGGVPADVRVAAQEIARRCR